MANGSHEFNLKSLEILDRYVALLTQEQDDLFKHLNLMLSNDRRLSDTDEWRDKNHDSFTEEFVVDMQRQIHATANSYDLAIGRLKQLRHQYSQVIS